MVIRFRINNGGIKKIKKIKTIITKNINKVLNRILLNQGLLYLNSPT